VPIEQRWLDLQVFNGQPLPAALSGLPLEYRLIQLYTRDSGQRSAAFSFDVGQGTQDLGFRNEVDVLFECRPGTCGHSARKGRTRRADHRGLCFPRSGQSRHAIPGKTTRPGLWISSAGLSLGR
jgi:hypothetical protein